MMERFLINETITKQYMTSIYISIIETNLPAMKIIYMKLLKLMEIYTATGYLMTPHSEKIVTKHFT